MKKLLSVVFALLVGLVAQTALAAVELDKLSNEQLAQLQAQAAKLQQERASQPAQALASLETVDKVVEISRNIGMGLAATARELGVAVNDFAKSDVGMWVMVVLVWKYLGQDILSVAVGLSLLVFGMGFGWLMVKRARAVTTNVAYAHVPMLFGLFSVKRVASQEHVPSDRLTDSQQLQQFFGYVTIAVCFITGLNVLF